MIRNAALMLAKDSIVPGLVCLRLSGYGMARNDVQRFWHAVYVGNFK